MIPSSASLASPSEADTAAERDARGHTNVWNTTVQNETPGLGSFDRTLRFPREPP